MNTQDTISLSRTTDLAVGEPGSMVTIPRQVGSVRLEREIGQGAMGVVWLGNDELLQRRVAVKFLLAAVQGPDDPRLAAFLEGARAAAALRHGNLTNILHAATIENVPYLVMEFVDGPALGAVIRKTGPLSAPELLAVMTDVCGAVGHLHEQDRVHRDIKPANILLDQQGNAYVTDFGLSREIARGGGGGGRPGVLKEGGAPIAGTPAYMAPEMFEGQVSARSDVYALGATAFELLAGEAPFAGSLDDIRRLQTEQPPPTDKLAARGVTQALADVVERALHRSVLFRHKSPAHFLAAIEPACGGPGVLARGRQLLWDRILAFRNAAPDSEPDAGGAGAPKAGAAAAGAPASSPPLTPGQTYYDRLTVIAEQKRREDVALAAQLAVEPHTAPRPALALWHAPQPAAEPANVAAAWPLALGIALAVLGGFQAAVGPLLMLALLAAPSIGVAATTDPATSPDRLWITFSIFFAIVALALGAMLAVAGFGLWFRLRWGVRLARAWAWSKMVFAVIAAALIYAAAHRADAPAWAEEMLPLTSGGTLVWGLLPPLLLLAWLHTRAARNEVGSWPMSRRIGSPAPADA